jgi:hypothetical protein
VRSTFRSQPGAEPIETTGPILNLQFDLNGYYIGVEMLPMREDDTCGEIVYAILERPVRPGEALEMIAGLAGSFKAFNPISVDFRAKWFRSNPRARGARGLADGFDSLATYGQKYTPTQEDIGRFLRIVGDSPPCDAIIGEILPDIPFIHRFDLLCSIPSVGAAVTIPARIFTPDDDGLDPVLAEANEAEYGATIKTEVVWVRVSGDKSRETVVDLDAHEYVLADEDVGNHIKAVVYPLDNKGRRCPPTESTPTPIVRARDGQKVIGSIVGELRQGSELGIDFRGDPGDTIYALSWLRMWVIDHHPSTLRTYTYHHTDQEDVYEIGEENSPDGVARLTSRLTYQLTPADVGHYMVAKLLLGRRVNGAITPTRSSYLLYPADRTAAVAGDAFRIKIADAILATPIPDGTEVSVAWEGEVPGKDREPTVIWERELEDYSWKSRAQGIRSRFTADDISCIFRVRCKQTGQTIELPDIVASLPTVTTVTLSQDSEGRIVVEDNYAGGHPGDSQISISFRSPDDGATLQLFKPSNIERVPKTRIARFIPSEKLFGHRIDAVVIPVREDDTRGRLCWSSSSIVVRAVPIITSVIFDPPSLTSASPGIVIRCTVTATNAAGINFKWRSRNKDVGSSSEYTLTSKDIGSTLECKVVAVSDEGFLSAPSISRFSLVEPDVGPFTINIAQWVDPRHLGDARSRTKRGIAQAVREGLINGDVLSVEDPDEAATYVWQSFRTPPAPLRTVWNEDAASFTTVATETTERSVESLPLWNDVGVGPRYMAALGDLDTPLRCLERTDEEEKLSPEFGPVKQNPVLEGTARSASRARLLKFKARAPVGPGQWDIVFGADVLVKNRTGKEQRVPWSDANCRAVPLTGDQLEFRSGDGKRFLMIPELEKAHAGITSDLQRDFVLRVFELMKEEDQKRKAGNQGSRK